MPLGFWDDDRPDDNPRVDEVSELVEVPAWRHALINYPHPLLKQGLVVLDTPGLNAIGAEPELTLSLLPTAHATVFILGADTGVTKSDMAIWRDHLNAEALSRYVVLNKIDALVDPLATAEQVREQIDAQCRETARTLGVPAGRVFPLSARQALAARVAGDQAGLVQSRLPALEAALGSQLMPRRRQLLEQVVIEASQGIENHVSRRLGDHRRQLAEQMLELRGLRGKNGSKLKLMLQRVDAEMAEFELCTTKLQALRSVHSRMLKDALIGLSSDRLREEVSQMQAEMNASMLNLGAKKAFLALCERLRALLGTAGKQKSRGPRHARRVVQPSQCRVRFQLGAQPGAGPRTLRRRPHPHREELRAVPRPDPGPAPVAAEVHGAVPAHADVQAAHGVRERQRRDGAVEQGGPRAQVDSQLRERRRGFRRVARRLSASRLRRANSRPDWASSRRKTSACRDSCRVALSSAWRFGSTHRAVRKTESTTPVPLDAQGSRQDEARTLQRAQA